MSPYQEALNWIEQHPGTGSAGSMAKLILSFWNSECAFTFRECISNLDGNLTQLAVRMAAHFAAHGEDQELIAVGHKVCERHPRLWEMGQAMTEARSSLSAQWRREDDEERARLYPDE